MHVHTLENNNNNKKSMQNCTKKIKETARTRKGERYSEGQLYTVIHFSRQIQFRVC